MPVAELNAVEGLATPVGVVVVGIQSKILALRNGLVSRTLAVPVPIAAVNDPAPVMINALVAPVPLIVPAETLITAVAPPPVWLPFCTIIAHEKSTSYLPGHIDDNSALTAVADKENEPQIVLQQ